ncbi:MAG TPA: heme lyase CcmF/NrfE family subunit [Gammaproteobacteria bacterium]|jgi:cytochrome c-type biogenesis protein CcmF|nr:heme lyase CcmF/NrfE family subunit [Gammaproteobacteria bacterium]
MAAEFGQLFLISALAASLMQFFLGLNIISLDQTNREILITRFTSIHCLTVFLAMLCLGYSFLTDDFSVFYVALNSHTNLPVPYKVAALWGAHEGSLLLWILLLSLWGTSLAYSKKFFDHTLVLKISSLSILGLVSFGFILFIIYTSNPFERIYPFPEQGQSLNPLLQDPALAIHPPILYAGYVGLAVPFALALASLMSSNDYHWAGLARIWAINSWLFLTGGIALGSWWAYYELGWGGWWFWDPVENASLMPWLVATALVHSLIVTEKKQIFNGFSALLAIIAFSLSLLGTFLVRSGVLISVHSFASDPERGLFILMLIGFFTGGALIIYALNQKRSKPLNLNLWSRESLLLLNNVFLCSAAGLIMIGTLYPLVLELVNSEKISVGPPYFNFVILFPFIPLMLFIGVAVFSSWNGTGKKLLVNINRLALLSIVMGLITSYLILGYETPTATLGIILALWTIFTGAMPVIKNLGSQTHQLIKNLPMALAHIGLGLTVLGITVTSSYGITFDDTLGFGQSKQVGSYEFKLITIEDRAGPNFKAKVATVDIFSNNKKVGTVFPEKRTYDSAAPSMTEAGIDSNLFRDLFVALGEDLGGGVWSMHLQFKPLLRLIWLGPFIMILGGLFRLFLLKPFSREI